MRIVVVCVFVVVLAMCGVSWWAGLQAERLQSNYLAQAEGAGTLSLGHNRLERGVFSTSGEGSLEFLTMPVAVDWTQTTEHGPVAWRSWWIGDSGLRPVQARITANSRLHFESHRGTVSLSDPISSSNTVLLSGDVDGEIALHRSASDIPSLGRLLIENLSASYHVEQNSAAFRVDASLGKIAVTTDAADYYGDGISANCATEPIDRAALSLRCNAHAEHVGWRLPLSSEGAMTVTDFDLEFAAQNSLDANTVEAHGAAKSLLSDAGAIAPLRARITLNGVESRQLANLLAALNRSDRAVLDVVRDHVLPLLASRSPRLGVDVDAGARLPAGERLRLALTLDVDGSRIIAASTLSLSLAIRVVITATIGKAVAERIDRICASQAAVPLGWCDYSMTATLSDWRARGFLIDKGDHYVIDADYANARLMLNGQPVSMFALFRGTLGTSG